MNEEKFKWFILIYCVIAPFLFLICEGFAGLFGYLFFLAIFVVIWWKKNVPTKEEMKQIEAVQKKIEEEEKWEWEKHKACYKTEDFAPSTSEAIGRAYIAREKIRDGSYGGNYCNGTLAEEWIQAYQKYYEEFKLKYPDDIRKARYSAADNATQDMLLKYWKPYDERFKKDGTEFYSLPIIFYKAANEVYGIEDDWEFQKEFDPQNNVIRTTLYSSKNKYSPVQNAGCMAAFFHSGIENPVLPHFMSYDKEKPRTLKGTVHEKVRPGSKDYNFFRDMNTALIKRCEFNMDTYILWQRGEMSKVNRDPMYGDKVSDIENVKISDLVKKIREERVQVANILTDRDWTYDDYMNWMHTMDDIFGEDAPVWTVCVDKNGLPIYGHAENPMIKYKIGTLDNEFEYM